MRLTEMEYEALMARRRSTSTAKQRPPAPRKDDPEHQEQKALIEWCDLQGYPFDLVFAIPNGGGRGKADAGKLKAEGVKAGVPDLCLPVARRGYHGLYIEMKAEDGAVRSEQTSWHTALRAEGYAVVVAWGWEHAARLMKGYVATGDVTAQPRYDVRAR